MNRLIVVVLAALFSNTVTSPTPKISESSKSPAWETLLEVGSDLQIKENAANSARSIDNSIEDHVENYLKNHDFTFEVPIAGSTVTVDAKNMENNEVDVKLRFSSGSEAQARKKSKIKKIFIPILVFILIKAITLIPLALGILGIKTWNAIQLSFISFVTTLAMAVWKLCSKVNGDHTHPQIIHEGFDHHHIYAAARSDDLQMAYNGHNNEKKEQRS